MQQNQKNVDIHVQHMLLLKLKTTLNVSGSYEKKILKYTSGQRSFQTTNPSFQSDSSWDSGINLQKQSQKSFRVIAD